MSYNNWYVSGDTHGNFSRFKQLKNKGNIAVITLGDNAVNWNLNEEDRDFKKYLQKKFPNITWYFLRGNHDARPTILSDLDEKFDPEISGDVYFQPDFPHINYLKDGGEYTIDGHTVLTIGGAYSVDKWYRLEMGYRWFKDEQLTQEEMDNILKQVSGKSYDCIMTHTCPYSWMPTDLFLPGLDQLSVDKTMEEWLDIVKEETTWCMWLFGHYHADRLERPYVEQLYTSIQNFSDLWDKWYGDDAVIDWHILRTPDYYTNY